MNDKMTPGPWEIWPPDEYPADFSDEVYMVSPGDETLNGNEAVAVCCGNDNEANARAIVALPELVEACKKMNEYFTNGIDLGYIAGVNQEVGEPLMEMARDALRKAGIT